MILRYTQRTDPHQIKLHGNIQIILRLTLACEMKKWFFPQMKRHLLMLSHTTTWHLICFASVIIKYRIETEENPYHVYFADLWITLTLIFLDRTFLGAILRNEELLRD